MLLINGNWEKVKTFEDVQRIIREYYNPELAAKMDGIEAYWKNEFDMAQIENSDLEDQIGLLEDENDTLQERIDALEEELEDLRS